ncbi:MAG: hypothetical protein M3Q08_00285 [Pseudomonadota bacterium]|nr:hypothetical protein [Pseudomonadota bacterium]
MRVTLALTLACLAGCAGTVVTPVKDGSDVASKGYADEDVDGIRYYESAPFLLVYSDGKGGLQSQLLFLPDQTRKRSIDPYAYLASNESTLVFSNGVLTQGKTVVDETVVPKAIVSALEKTATALLAGSLNAAGAGPTPQLPPPQLFRIVIEKDGARLVGGPGVDQQGQVRMIDVTVSAPGSDDGKPATKGEKPKEDEE